MEKENIIDDHFVGDTWDGMELKIENLEDDGITVTGPVDLTGSSIRSHFKKRNSTEPVFKFSTEDGSIKILDAANGIIEFQPLKMDFNPGEYNYDVEVTFPDGNIKTLFQDYWNLLNDVTK